jgi:Mn-dependent DtxR family transcriptional regulator
MKNSTKKGTKKSAINRSNMKGDILKVIENAKKPISTAEIADILKRSWHTIIRYCLDLENEGKLIKFEIGRINVWQIKR